MYVNPSNTNVEIILIEYIFYRLNNNRCGRSLGVEAAKVEPQHLRISSARYCKLHLDVGIITAGETAQ